LSCELIDEFGIEDDEALGKRAFKVQNMSAVFELSSRFADGTTLVAPIASHLNAAEWRTALPNGATGLILRRTYDQFHGRQRARVFVDGRLTGWWYDAQEDRGARWAVSDYGVSSEHLEAKSEVTIAIEPPAGSPLWSVSRVEVYALQGV
jgi:hypothetical protein